MRRRRSAAAIAATLACLALSACGSSNSFNAQMVRDSDQVLVTTAEVHLASAVENGTTSDMFDETQKVVSAIEKARADGVSETWLDKEINSAESDVEIVPCQDCFTRLEDARR